MIAATNGSDDSGCRERTQDGECKPRTDSRCGLQPEEEFTIGARAETEQLQRVFPGYQRCVQFHFITRIAERTK